MRSDSQVPYLGADLWSLIKGWGPKQSMLLFPNGVIYTNSIVTFH